MSAWLAAAIVSVAVLAALPSQQSAADHCAVADLPTPSEARHGYLLALLDRTHALPADFVPPDLVEASAAGFDEYADGREGLVRELILSDLAALRRDAAAAGHEIQLQSAYRSYATQEATFAHWVSVGGYEAALATSARAGHSEHQLGTAVDLTSGSVLPWELADWAAEPAGAWVAENAWRYGFVMSYPAGAQDVTCYEYEPWHYRWVGQFHAAEQRASGVTLREYLECCSDLHRWTTWPCRRTPGFSR